MKVLIIVAYDGTNYSGWQRQDNAGTVQGEIENALYAITEKNIEIIGASRTDAGVHSLGNLAVFDVDSTIPGDRWCKVLNQYLPEDIVITKSFEVDDEYNPRYEKYRKTYEYTILNRDVTLPTYERNAYFVYGKLDVNAMREGAAFLVGEHDFASFCGAGSQVKTTVRNVVSVDIDEENLPVVTGEDDGKLIKIRVTGDGFLYNMVRIIAGTLIEVGQGKRKPSDINEIIKGKERKLAGKTAPAKGLALLRIEI